MKWNQLVRFVALSVIVSTLLVACKADKQQSPTQPGIPGVNFPVAAAFACFVFVDQPGFMSFEDRSLGAPTSWAWTFGDGATATEQHPKHQYAFNGRYYVGFTARDDRTSSTTYRLAITNVGCTICGDEIVEPGELCDDGNTLSGDGCNGFCVIEFCGDGIVQRGIGEECEDGNFINGDGCESDCTLTPPPPPPA